MKECPVCKQLTPNITYDDPRNNGWDRMECTNPECRWLG